MPDLADATRFPPQGKPGDASFDGMSADDQLAVNQVYANFGKAIAAYERKLADSDTPFDRFMHGDASALSDSAVRGAKLLVGRAACNECHNGPTLADGKFHNHAIPQIGSAVPAIDRGRADGIPSRPSTARADTRWAAPRPPSASDACTAAGPRSRRTRRARATGSII